MKKSAKELWEELGDIPINEDDETEQEFHDFPKGTPREDIWHWLEEIDSTFSVGEQFN